MKTSRSVLALTVCSMLLGACAANQEEDVRLAPTLSEEELQVITESNTGTHYIDRKVVLYNSQVKEEDQVICRMEWVEGTRTSQVVCRAANEHDFTAEEAQRAIRNSGNPAGCARTAACGGQN